MTLEKSTTFDRLRDLTGVLCKLCNKHELAVTLIKECIADGIDTRGTIVAMLRQLGFNYRHVNIVLDEATGPFPYAHHWQLGADGRYTVHSSN